MAFDQAKYNREYYMKNREKILANNKEYIRVHGRSEEQEAKRSKTSENWGRLKHTGVTPEEYEIKLVEQDHKCAICGSSDEQLGQRLCADHNHDTKQKRGLLCHDCNVAIARLKESPELLVKAIEYLKKYNSNAVGVGV